MSTKFKIGESVELQVKNGRTLLDRLLIEPEFEVSWKHGDINGWLDALGFEYAGEHKLPPQECMTIEERRKVILEIMSVISETIKEEIKQKAARRKGWG